MAERGEPRLDTQRAIVFSPYRGNRERELESTAEIERQREALALFADGLEAWGQCVLLLRWRWLGRRLLLWRSGGKVDNDRAPGTTAVGALDIIGRAVEIDGKILAAINAVGNDHLDRLCCAFRCRRQSWLSCRRQIHDDGHARTAAVWADDVVRATEWRVDGELVTRPDSLRHGHLHRHEGLLHVFGRFCCPLKLTSAPPRVLAGDPLALCLLHHVQVIRKTLLHGRPRAPSARGYRPHTPILFFVRTSFSSHPGWCDRGEA
jgi:hypothetical protein